VTHNLILWVPGLPAVQILDYRTETFDRRITTQTTIDWNFIDAIKTVQILEDYKLVSLQLALAYTETAIINSTTNYRYL